MSQDERCDHCRENGSMDQNYLDSMPETADHVALDYDISRADQDAFALRSQQRW
ncbi:hypothetical protein N9H79_00655, partial [bacterium]|nr:hypothetical protein [bacterium]